MEGYLVFFLLLIASLIAPGSLLALIVYDQKKKNKSLVSGEPVEWKRRWFQWIIGIPLFFMAAISFLSPLPEGLKLWNGINQVDIFTQYLKIAGHLTPSFILALFTYLSLKKYKVYIDSERDKK